MTMLVHLFDSRQAASVRRSGLKGAACALSVAGNRVELDRGVFVMPVLPNFYASHQWLRELKRRGMRTISAAYVRMRSDALVYVGRYNGEHRRVPLGHAAGLVMRAEDPRGWEIVVPWGIGAGAVHAVREVPQVVGWRYFPRSHEEGPWTCLCDFCRRGTRGEIKATRLRRGLVEKFGAERLSIESDVESVIGGKRKRVKKKLDSSGESDDT